MFDSTSIIISGGISLIILSLGGVISWKVHNGDVLRRTTPLFYELEFESAKRFSSLQKAAETLGKSSRIWRIQTQQYTSDQKRNAGATSLLTRSPVIVRQEQPPYIATNVKVWSLKLSDQTLYFLPDFLFIFQNGLYGAIPYESLNIDYYPTRFIEDQPIPSDSRMVDSTWQYVNKKGGPDRRFSNNRQLPIMEYEFIHLQSRTGMNIHMHISNVEKGRVFSEMLSSRLSSTQTSRQSRPRTERDRVNGGYDKVINDAFKVLGLSSDATLDEIVANYRQMAKMYHPDRLMHLAPEFVEVAEERMKEINFAYQTIKSVKK